MARPLRLEFAGALYHVTSLRELGRYVVLNPVRARMVARAQDWRWSSYRAVLGMVEAPKFLDVDWLLSHFGSSRERPRPLTLPAKTLVVDVHDIHRQRLVRAWGDRLVGIEDLGAKIGNQMRIMGAQHKCRDQNRDRQEKRHASQRKSKCGKGRIHSHAL